MKFVRMVLLVILLGGECFTMSAFATGQEDFNTAPVKNAEGRKWRIGYYQGGQYTDYQKCLIAIIQQLMELHWIERQEIPAQADKQTRELWNWLAANIRSDYVQFVEDAHYTADWNKELREKTSAEIIQRLNESQDIDLMIAAGTWAGQDLANDQHHTPTIVISASDPLAAGIIKSAENSGYAHIHARIDPYRYERQVRTFYKTLEFRKLGVAYEDTLEGRSYAAIGDVENVAQELGFELIRCHTGRDDAVPEVAEESLKACFQTLCKQADAIYVTVQPAVKNPKSIIELVNIANSYNIPTFSQSGSEEVKYGYLMSISLAGFKYVGAFWAETIANVFNGAQPGDLEQIFENPPKIAINLKTAEIIEYYPPVDILRSADEIYQEIATPE